MPTETKAPDEVAELVKVLPPHLREEFDKAEAEIKEVYGISPGVPTLMRMWLACGKAWRVREEFESAVLGINGKTGRPPVGETFDEDDI